MTPIALQTAIESLPDLPLASPGPTQTAFLARGVTTLRDACHWVHALPYDHTSSVADVFSVLEEGRGTCFTKHGVIASLAEELEIPLEKQIGFYRLTEEILTGMAELLERYDLPFVPQIHCFLDWHGTRIDLTDGNETGKNKPIDSFDFVIPVPPATTTDLLRSLFHAHLPKYAALHPQLAKVPPETITDVVQASARLSLLRCALP
jgi:hypothetical protein